MSGDEVFYGNGGFHEVLYRNDGFDGDGGFHGNGLSGIGSLHHLTEGFARGDVGGPMSGDFEMSGGGLRDGRLQGILKPCSRIERNMEKHNIDEEQNTEEHYADEEQNTEEHNRDHNTEERNTEEHNTEEHNTEEFGAIDAASSTSGAVSRSSRRSRASRRSRRSVSS